MKYSVLLITVILLSCTNSKKQYEIIVAEENYINVDFIKTISAPEKALLSWYLYAYGNECSNNSTKIKCLLLDELKIKNECNSNHINNLLKWFSTDKLAIFKLKKCPNLKANSAIQNTIDKISMRRNSDTLSITIKVRGQNESQEKHWNSKQTEHFLIESNSFRKIKI